MRAAVRGIRPLPDPRSTTTSSSRRSASLSIRSTLSGVLAWKNENRSWAGAGAAARTTRIVASVTRVTIASSTSTAGRHSYPSAGSGHIIDFARTDHQPLAGTVEPDAADSVLFSMVKFLLWCLLLVVCWPLALLALVLYPLVWLLLIPFRLIGIAVEGVLGLVRGIVMLPARLLAGPRAF